MPSDEKQRWQHMTHRSSFLQAGWSWGSLDIGKGLWPFCSLRLINTGSELNRDFTFTKTLRAFDDRGCDVFGSSRGIATLSAPQLKTPLPSTDMNSATMLPMGRTSFSSFRAFRYSFTCPVTIAVAHRMTRIWCPTFPISISAVCRGAGAWAQGSLRTWHGTLRENGTSGPCRP